MLTTTYHIEWVDDPLSCRRFATSAILTDIDEIMMSRGATGKQGEEDSVRLQSSDGETFEVSLRVAKLSRTIETMLRGQHNYVFIPRMIVHVS